MTNNPTSTQMPTTDSRPFACPAANTLETPDAYLLEIELPGVSRENVDINVSEGILEITGSPQRRKTQPVVSETSDVRFRRSFQIGDNVDTSKAVASLADGLLVLRLPKSESSKTRKIPVE